MEETHRGIVEGFDDTELGYMCARGLTHADLLMGDDIAAPHRLTGLCDTNMKIA
jgi:hypothetical protein